MGNKRGLSGVITTLIIILLVIAAIGIIWAVVNPFIRESSEEISLAKFTLDLSITQASVDTGTETVSVGVKRGQGEGDLVGLKFVMWDGSNSVVAEKSSTLAQQEMETYYITASDIEDGWGLVVPSGIIEVSVAPVYATTSGTAVTGEIADTYIIGVGSVGDGGDGPLPPGGGETCGSDSIEGAEVCDGIDLGGKTCVTQGFESGTLTCLPDCSGYNTDDCSSLCIDGTEKDCSLQLGVCAGATQICVAGAWPGCDYLVYNPSYEIIESICNDGFDNDCNGLTDNEEDACELTWSGTVGTPWPETKLLFDIVETTEEFTTLDHVFEYISFGNEGGTEIRCIVIYDYIRPIEQDPPIYEKSIVKLDESLIPFTMASGDSFTIYEKTKCGEAL